jgi:thiamine pyrophosphate-dependent acetolactate synthase large subunit-like protein
MKSRQLFPEGLILMSIPYDLLPSMINNLQDMKWVPHSYTIGRDEHKKKVKRIVDELKQEFLTK